MKQTLTSVPNANEERHWRVKNDVNSPWRDLPGSHTTMAIWQMRVEGLFVAAIPADEGPPEKPKPDR